MGGYLAWFAWASYQAGAKIDDEVAELVDARGRVDVEVELAFPPERFHILVIQDHGRIRRTIGETIHVRAEIPDLRRLARRHWIVGIRPAEDPLGLSRASPSPSAGQGPQGSAGHGPPGAQAA